MDDIDFLTLTAEDLRCLSRVRRFDLARIPRRFTEAAHPQFVSTMTRDLPRWVTLPARIIRDAVADSPSARDSINGTTRALRYDRLVVVGGRSAEDRTLAALWALRWGLMVDGISGCYVTATELTDMIMETASGGFKVDERTWGSENLYSALIAKFDIVVVDGVGLEPAGPSEYRYDQLASFVDRRVRAERMTMITTGLDGAEWGEKYARSPGMVQMMTNSSTRVTVNLREGN